MKKEELAQLLTNKLTELHDWVRIHDDSQFEISKRPEKWNTGQHVDHLIRSMAPLNTAFKLPKFFLRYKFGINNREERSFDETHKKYLDKIQNKGSKAMGRFIPSNIKNADKSQKLSEFKCQGKKFVANINKQSEENLSKYIIPHPILGYLTLREFGYFTAIHTNHHLDTLKKYH